MVTASNWFFWALLSAVFAALTAIFAKIGLEGVDSDLATLVRTVVIVAVLAGFVSVTGKWANPFELSSRTLLFLVLSGLATGTSWVCYFRALKIGEASKVAPVDKLTRLGGFHAKPIHTGSESGWHQRLGDLFARIPPGKESFRERE
jgi:transporter family protein